MDEDRSGLRRKRRADALAVSRYGNASPVASQRSLRASFRNRDDCLADRDRVLGHDDLVCFIEDSDEQWIAQAMWSNSDVEVRR